MQTEHLPIYLPVKVYLTVATLLRITSFPAVALHWNNLSSPLSSSSAASTSYSVPVAPLIKSVASLGGVEKCLPSWYQEYVIPVLPVATQDRVTVPPELTVCDTGCDVNLNISGPDDRKILSNY